MVLFRVGMDPRSRVMGLNESCVKRPFPIRFDIMKGYKNVAITRGFADFVLDHPLAVAFYDWIKA